MPTLACAVCNAEVYAATGNAARILCATCAPKTPFDGLPIWPGAAHAMLPGTHHMMADDDDDGDEDRPAKKGKGRSDDDEDGDDQPSSKKGKSKSRRDDDDDDRPRKKKGAEEAKGGMGMGAILGIVGAVLLCCVCAPGGGLVVFLVGLQGQAGRQQSTNNLKNIGLGFHSYHDTYKRLPFNGSNLPVGGTKYSATAFGNNPVSGSWAFQILPYVEENAMYTGVIKTKAVAIYMCPGRGRPQLEGNGGGAWTDYFINAYLNDPNQASKPDAADFKRTLMAITDGTSNTIMVGHGNILVADYKKSSNVTGSSNIFIGGTVGTQRSGASGVANPQLAGIRKDSDIAPGAGAWGGPYAEGGLMCMGDATVRIFPYTTGNFSAFLTPTGNEMVILPGFD